MIEPMIDYRDWTCTVHVGPYLSYPAFTFRSHYRTIIITVAAKARHAEATARLDADIDALGSVFGHQLEPIMASGIEALERLAK